MSIVMDTASEWVNHYYYIFLVSSNIRDYISLVHTHIHTYIYCSKYKYII